LREAQRAVEVSRDELRVLVDEQAALRRVAVLVARGVPPAEVFPAVAAEVSVLFGSDVSAIVRFESDGTMTVLGDVGGPHEAGARVTPDPGYVVHSVRETGRSARFDTDAPAAAGAGSLVRSLGVRSAVASPIVVEGELWGAITAASLAGPLSPDAEQQLTEFTELVATAVANTEARERATVLAEEQAALRRVATLVARGASQAEVFNAIAEGVGELLGAEAIRMVRYEQDEAVLVVAGVGDPRPLPVGSRFPLGGDNAITRVFRTRRPARIDDYTSASGQIAESAHRIRGVVVSPILVEGRLWGAYAVAAMGDEQLPVDTESRLGQFTELMATAIANADSREQLTASRARLVTAGIEARRRVVRDLHDGAQQRLVHTIVKLKLAQQSFNDGDAAESLVGDALEHAQLANAELRELAHGILPAALTRGGLRAGIASVVTRCDLRVDVDVPDQRFATDIEANAYFIVAEALTNAVKHAQADGASVRVLVEDELLRVEIRDDGIGGADPASRGMVGIADRATALGGRLTVESPSGCGTRVVATLPLG